MFDTMLSVLARVGGLFGRRRNEEEFEEEIAEHIAMLTAENMRRGMSAGDAARAARRSFGGLTQVRETQRELRAIPHVDIFWGDVRYALRAYARIPALP